MKELTFDEKVAKVMEWKTNEKKKLFLNSGEKLENILNIKKYGFPKGYDIDITSFNNLMRFHDGNLMVITGYSYHGKSHFIEQCLCNLMCRHKLKIGYYSAESESTITFMRSIEIINGTKLVNTMENEIINISKFLNDKMYVINTDNGLLTQKQLFEHIEVAFKVENCNMFLIDNASTISDLATDDKNGIRNFLNEVKLICKTHKKTIIIVAHPTKPSGPASIFDGYKISGAAEWFNLIDVGITIFREELNSIVSVWKCKNYWQGNSGKIELTFDYHSRRFNDNIINSKPMINFEPSKYDIPTTRIDLEGIIDNDTPF